VKNGFALTAMLIVAPLSVHARSVDLQVRGTLAPAACTVLLGQDGRFDLGVVSGGMLSRTEETQLPDQRLDFRMQCAAPTMIALSTTDLRAGTASGTGTVGFKFGLGLTPEGEKIGSTLLRLDDLMVDGVDARTIFSSDQGGNWFGGPQIESAFRPDWWSTFAVAGTPTPLVLQSVGAVLRTVTMVAPRAELTMTDEIALDGAVLIELKYL